MHKITMILSFLFLLDLHSRGQDSSGKITFIYEVDSILNHIKDLKNDQVILYYPDGAMRYGIILWAKEKLCAGIAFKKTANSFFAKDISMKNINRSLLLNQFKDSFEVFKKYIPHGSYEISHDFNIAWVYSVNTKTDTVIRAMSEIIGGGDYFGKSIFLKFEKLFDLSMPPNSSPIFRKKRQVKNVK